MAIKLSKYVRQGKKTFRFMATSGGVYGSSIGYEYGYFNGNKFKGLKYSYHSETEIEYDDDEKDGIGSMRTVRKCSAWLGSFIDGQKDGLCMPLPINSEKSKEVFFVDGHSLTAEDMIQLMKENGDQIELDGGATGYMWGENALIYNGDNLQYLGQMYDDENPYFCLIFDENGQQVSGAFFLGEEEIPFIFDNWEKMPVDPVEEDGFSVLREMDFFSDSNVRYTVKEGLFANGQLNGLGMECYNSDCNGFHREYQEIGFFKDGELLFGYKKSYESRSKSIHVFGYADKREIEQYGAEIVYDGKKYVGEAVDGVPNGIGCLFVSDEKMMKGTFKNGKLHGVGVTYKYLDGKWVPYDFEIDKKDDDFYWNSFNMYADGEIQTDMTWEEFYDQYENVKKV